jgi:hypothetical protein
LTLLAFPYPSKGFFTLSFKGRKKCNSDPFGLPLSFKGIFPLILLRDFPPNPFKGEKSAILTLLVKNYNFERCGQKSAIMKYLAILGELLPTSQRFINCCNYQ